MSTLIIPSAGAYSNPALDAFIETKHDENLQKAGLIGVTTAAKINIKPETSLKVLAEPIHAEYNSLVAKAHKINEGYLNVMQAKLDVEKLLQDNASLLIDMDKTAGELAIEKYKTGEVIIPSKPTRKLILALSICCIILFMDGYFLGTAFQQSGSNLLISMILGLGCSLSIIVIATLGTKYTEKIKDMRIRFLALCCLGALVGISVYILSSMRSSFYSTTSGESIDAWKLTILSVLAFVAFHLLYKLSIRPAYTILRERKEALQKLAKIKKLENKLHFLNSSYAENLQKINIVKQQRLAVLAYAKSLEISITRLYHQAISEFKRHFIETAGFVPFCFNQSTPDLSRFYDKVTLTPTNNNNNEKPE